MAALFFSGTAMGLRFALPFSAVVLATMTARVDAVEAPTHHCATIPEADARLACYDAAFSPLPQQVASSTAAPSKATPAAPPPSTDKDFGFTAEEARIRSSAKAAGPATREQHMKVASLKRKPTGEFIANMANGQVWEQTELNSKARLRAGSEVRIKHGAFGSFLLVTPDGIGTRVRRVQ